MNVLKTKNIFLFDTLKNAVNSIKTRQLSSTDYCLDTIKKYDYENFVCTLLLRNKARNVGVAIRAFNVEISRVQDQISDPKIGLMRMQFWEEALDRCYTKDNKIPDHPVVIELNRIIKSNKLTKRNFQNLIKSRKEIMLANNFPTLAAMETYAEQSVSSIYYLLLEGMDVRNVHADHAASHLGKAQGLSQLIRSIAATRHSSFVPLPQELMTEFKISHEDVIRGKNTDAVKECVFKVATRANQHLEKARNLAKSVPDEAKIVLLPASVVDNYLQRLLRVDCDIFQKSIQGRNLTWIPQIWWRSLRKTY